MQILSAFTGSESSSYSFKVNCEIAKDENNSTATSAALYFRVYVYTAWAGYQNFTNYMKFKVNGNFVGDRDTGLGAVGAGGPGNYCVSDWIPLSDYGITSRLLVAEGTAISFGFECYYNPYDGGAISSSGTVDYTLPRSTKTLSYNANGGSGAPASVTVTPGTATILSSTIPTRSGYSFLGWSAYQNATQATYAAGGSITISSDTTLYAVWSINQITVTFNANGGLGGPAAISANANANVTIPSTIPTKTGCKFLGWHTSQSATAGKYQAGTVAQFSTNTTLFAIWDKTASMVKVKVNGVFQNGVVYVKQNGVYKQCMVYVKHNGQYKLGGS